MSRYIAILASLTIGFAPSVVHSHMGHAPLDIPDLTRRAGTIVECEVVETRGEWNAAGSQIHTTVTLRVDQIYKGRRGNGQIRLRLLGGIVGDRTMSVIGQPAFAPGERILLFLKPDWEGSEFPTVEMEHGVLRAEGRAGRDVLVDTAGVAIDRTTAIDRIREVGRAHGAGRP